MTPLPPRRPSHSHVFITHEFYPKRGGIATFVEELSQASSVLGHEVEVWAQALPRGGGRGAEKDFPFRVRRLPLRGTHDLRCLLALARVFFAERRRLREASVYLVEPGPILAFLWLQFFPKVWPCELCLTFHGSEILKLHRCPLRRALTRRLIARATRVSTLTHYTRDLLFERFPEARTRFVLTPGALRQSVTAANIASGSMATSARASLAARPSASSAQEANREAAPPLSQRDEPRLVVLTVGRLHPRKGQLHTLNALAALPPELQRKVEYWLVGSAAERGEGKRYAERLRERAGSACAIDADAGSLPPQVVYPLTRESNGAEERRHTLKVWAQPSLCRETSKESGLVVKFLGDVPDEELGAIYAQADIFALTSVAHGASIEGFGLVYLEASAHGLPIIAHDIGGVSEAVSDGHTGILVAPSDDPSALRDAFARLIEDAELRTRLGAASPAWARRQTWCDSAAALLGAGS